MYEFFYICIGALLTCFGQKLIQYMRVNHNSPYSGEWIGDIYEDDTRAKVIKSDRYHIKYNKKNKILTGTIDREVPERTGRHWNMNGVIDGGNYLIICFWADAMQKSNGCIYVKLTNDYEYAGYYLEEHNGVIDKTPINLRKEQNVSRFHRHRK